MIFTGLRSLLTPFCPLKFFFFFLYYNFTVAKSLDKSAFAHVHSLATALHPHRIPLFLSSFLSLFFAKITTMEARRLMRSDSYILYCNYIIKNSSGHREYPHAFFFSLIKAQSSSLRSSFSGCGVLQMYLCSCRGNLLR